MFGGIIKLLGGMLGEAAIDEFEDRVDATLDNAKLKVERIAENVVRKALAVTLLVMGMVFGLIGLGIFLTARVPVLAEGVGFIVIGLFIVLLAMVVKFTRDEKKE